MSVMGFQKKLWNLFNFAKPLRQDICRVVLVGLNAIKEFALMAELSKRCP